MREKVPKAQT